LRETFVVRKLVNFYPNCGPLNDDGVINIYKIDNMILTFGEK